MPRKKKIDIENIHNEDTKKNKKTIMNTMVKNKNEHIILQLPINETNINNIINNKKNDNEPIPYEKKNIFNTNNKKILDNDEIINKNEFNNFKNNIEKISYNNLKKSYCFWCVHPIEFKVYSMPINFDSISNTYICFGSFCSLQCANAYNFSVNSGSDKVWEINSLIQMLGKLYNMNIPIRPAPSRYLLNIFSGGKLSIEEYRKLHLDHDTSHVLNLPPMINISSGYEIINTSYIKNLSNNLKKNGITSQLNKDNSFNTIDEKMNIIIKK